MLPGAAANAARSGGEGTGIDMSDSLDKILAAEKAASELVAQAEAEAAHRVSQVRAERQKKVSEAMKQAARAGEAAVKAERERAAAEREKQNREYREKLARRPLDPAAFAKAVHEFIDKSGMNDAGSGRENAAGSGRA
jgi:vacuolar-type H+-ATPase subunit H